MSGVLLLQFCDDVSDEEAVARCEYDLRWKVRWRSIYPWTSRVSIRRV